MRPLLIGQAPGPNTDPDMPLYPVPSRCAGGRLASYMGLSRGEYLKTFERINLLPYYPGKVKRDDKFPMLPAKLAAAAVRPLLAGRTVVLVGRNVANAFVLDPSLQFHRWYNCVARQRPCLIAKDPFMMRTAIIPHPSGRNHWYNDPENLLESQGFWSEFVSAGR